MVPVGQKSVHGLTGSSAQDLTKLQFRRWLGCTLIRRLNWGEISLYSHWSIWQNSFPCARRLRGLSSGRSSAGGQCQLLPRFTGKSRDPVPQWKEYLSHYEKSMWGHITMGVAVFRRQSATVCPLATKFTGVPHAKYTYFLSPSLGFAYQDMALERAAK